MLTFNPPYSFRRQLGQDASTASQQAAAASSAAAATVPTSAPAAPAPASAPATPNYDQGLITLTPAGALVGGVVLLGIAFSLAGAFAKR